MNLSHAITVEVTVTYGGDDRVAAELEAVSDILRALTNAGIDTTARATFTYTEDDDTGAVLHEGNPGKEDNA